MQHHLPYLAIRSGPFFLLSESREKLARILRLQLHVKSAELNKNWVNTVLSSMILLKGKLALCFFA